MPILSKHIPLNRVPISIITGFLGSGKTTLINNLVNQPGMDKTALIINEFGEIGLDNLLVETAIENTLLLENGCICCSIRGDLIDTINDLFAKVKNGEIPQFSRILIETTGLANPAPIVKSIQSQISVVDRCHLNNVITMVDGVQGAFQMLKHEEAVLQIAQADIAIISKSDLASAREVQKLEEGVLRINPTLKIKSIKQGKIDPEFLFQASIEKTFTLPVIEHRHEHQSDFNHGDVVTWSILYGSPLDEKRLRDWLSMLYTLRPFSMLRMKGFVWLADSERALLIQAVGNIISPPEWHDSWPAGEMQTQLVFIFKGLSPASMSASFTTHVLNQ